MRCDKQERGFLTGESHSIVLSRILLVVAAGGPVENNFVSTVDS